MKVWKKCGVLFLTVLLCITMMAVPALAASDSQDGLEVTLTTDKEKYSKSEEIAATLTVTNTNDTAVSNVSLENLIPEGYKLADGSEAAKQVESLDAGETVSLTVTYVAKESDADEDKPNTGDDNKGNTEKPDTGDNSGNTGNIGENKGNTTTGGGTDKEKKSDVESGNKNNTTENKDTTEKAADKTSLTPTTGDNTNIAFWVVLLLLAGSGNVILWGDSGAEVSNYIHGTVRSALTGSAISDVTVRFRPGWDNKNGTLATVVETDTDAVTVTDDNGQYSLEVLEGCYTAEFSKEGYITGYANVICTNMDNADQDGVITPVLSDDEYRIVLTWSSTPSDLDSHLSGPLSTGERFHVYYSDMSAFDNGQTVATLDLDDTSSYGPETITLKKTQDGIYKYAVHDYSNRSNASSTELSMSGAKVKLYCGNTLLATYNVPINVAGNVWNVFEIEGDTVRTINTIESKSNPSMIFSDDVSGVSETAMDIDKDKLDENKSVVESGSDNDFEKELDISEE